MLLKSLAGALMRLMKPSCKALPRHLSRGENEIGSPGSANKAGEPHDSAVIRHEAEPHLGETNHGFGIHDPQVTAGGDLAHRRKPGVNGSNDRYGNETRLSVLVLMRRMRSYAGPLSCFSIAANNG